MATTREPIYQALANLVFNDPRVQAAFRTTKRLLPHVDDVAANQTPALYTFQLPEKWERQGKGIPAKRTLHVAFVAYFTANADGPLPATLINTAMDVLDDVLEQPGNPGNVQTLGGLVEHARIEPNVNMAEGLLQDKSVLVATVSILIP